jgi:hypothetical protein
MVGTPDENDEPPARRITEGKPWGRRDGRPWLMWMDGVTEDLHRKRISNWKDKAGDRRAWRNILQKARTLEEM